MQWKRWGRWILLVSFMPTLALARPQGFEFKRLPKGADVTLPKPAVTFVPVNERITVTSTDLPQSLKLSVTHIRSHRDQKPFRVAIFDPNSERVRYIVLKPGMPYLYNFKSLGSISLLPEVTRESQKLAKKIGLRIESNKPLSIRR